ncbi:hypothetical protein QJQ45_010893 [Haematococcus lacustris]|nr:hypothetical protein QJQ45_010893 [Haematococcus lacustris]
MQVVMPKHLGMARDGAPTAVRGGTILEEIDQNAGRAGGGRGLAERDSERLGFSLACRLRLYGAQDRELEKFFKKLEKEMAEVAMKRHGRAKQLVVFFGAADIGTRGGVLMRC